MPRLAELYFKTAVIFFIIGIGIGLKMAISEDHTVTGAHAHCNLLGWVSMALFGVYYALNPSKAERRIAMIQYYIYTAGVVIMVPSLYMMLEGNMAMEPLVAASSLIVFVGVLLFAFVLFSSKSTIISPTPQPMR